MAYWILSCLVWHTKEKNRGNFKHYPHLPLSAWVGMFMMNWCKKVQRGFHWLSHWVHQRPSNKQGNRHAPTEKLRDCTLKYRWKTIEVKKDFKHVNRHISLHSNFYLGENTIHRRMTPACICAPWSTHPMRLLSAFLCCQATGVTVWFTHMTRFCKAIKQGVNGVHWPPEANNIFSSLVWVWRMN